MRGVDKHFISHDVCSPARRDGTPASGLSSTGCVDRAFICIARILLVRPAAKRITAKAGGTVCPAAGSGLSVIVLMTCMMSRGALFFQNYSFLYLADREKTSARDDRKRNSRLMI
jgi:hypothetical protein